MTTGGNTRRQPAKGAVVPLADAGGAVVLIAARGYSSAAGRPTSGTAPVAHAVGEDLLQPGPLAGVGLPVAVDVVVERLVDGLERALPDAALVRPAGHPPRRRVDRELLRARPGACSSSRTPSHTCRPEAISEPSVAKHESTARAGRLRATLRWGWAAMLAIHSSMTSNAIGVWSKATAGRASVNQMTWLPASLVDVEHALAGGERLVAVVHVELVLEVVAPVDDRDVDVALELHARRVGGVHGLDVALGAGRRRRAAVGAEVHVPRAPRVEVLGRQRPRRTGSPRAPSRRSASTRRSGR